MYYFTHPRFLRALAIALLVSLPAGPATSRACSLGWSPTIADALANARLSQRLAVVVFTGSDWSVRSMKVDQEILMNAEFSDVFMRHFALANADFPQRQPPAPTVLAENTEVATKFKIRSWPTFLALRPDGSEFARFEYGEETAGEVTKVMLNWQARFAQEHAASEAQPPATALVP